MLKGVLNWKCDFHVKTRWIPIPARKHRKNISQPPASGKKLQTRDENCTFKLGISIHDSFDISCILTPFPFVAVRLGVCCCSARRFPPRGKNVVLMILMCTLLNDNGNKVLALEALFDSIAPANFYYRYASAWKWRKSIASLSVLPSRSQFHRDPCTQHKSLEDLVVVVQKARVIFNIMSMCFPVTSTTN